MEHFLLEDHKLYKSKLKISDGVSSIILKIRFKGFSLMKKEDWDKLFIKNSIICLNKNNLSCLMQGIDWIFVTNSPIEIYCSNVQ